MCAFSDSMESSANQCADLEHEADNLERYEQEDLGDVSTHDGSTISDLENLVRSAVESVEGE